MKCHKTKKENNNTISPQISEHPQDFSPVPKVSPGEFIGVLPSQLAKRRSWTFRKKPRPTSGGGFPVDSLGGMGRGRALPVFFWKMSWSAHCLRGKACGIQFGELRNGGKI